MEEELERELVNDTMLEHEHYYYPSYYRTLHHVITILLAVTGVLSDLVIIYTIAKCKILHKKAYIILMNFCINDALFLLLFPISLSLDYNIHCFLEGGTTCIFSCIILMLILLMDPLINKDSITIRSILLTLYIPGLVLAFIKTVFCFAHYRLRGFQFVLLILVGLLVLVVLAFEVITFIKKRTSVVDQNYMFRFNLVRIYTYNLVILILSLLVGFADIPRYDMFVDFFILSYLLSSFYLLLYVILKDKTFHMCIISIIRRDQYKIDSTLNSSDCTVQLVE